ncbi:MAG TPA: ribosomal protein S18-alanine N-acetyltransferase [Thermoanaerobaculia bacterium]|jgi:ribosomal-protein-alanine N-acetyltransferase
MTVAGKTTAPDLSPVVRPAFETDLDTIARLEEAAFQDPWPREMLAYEVAHPHSVLLLAACGPAAPPAAYAAFRHAAGEAELLRVAVHPDGRRRGLARALLHEGLERLREQRIQVCFLEVRVDNKPAITLYESLGFAWAGLRRAYYRDGADAMIFALEL